MGGMPTKLQMTVLVSLLLFSGNYASGENFELTLLHTNDVHARVEETNEHSGACKDGPCFAGVARRFTKIKEIRSQERNVLLLDAGDQFQGTAWFTHYKGAEAAHFMNELKYDAMALGNHEFDNGVEGLISPFLQEVNFSVLSANIEPQKTLSSEIAGYYTPFKIFDVNSEKVAVVGYTTTETPLVSQPGPDLVFEDEIKAVQLQVDKLITLGINKIIALGHSGFTIDQEIAKKVKGVDVVIGGHSDTFLYTGTPPSTEVPDGPYPFMVQSEDGHDVPVVQAYAFGKYLGSLKVTFDEAGRVMTAIGNPILLDSTVPEDPAVRADVEEWKKGFANYSSMFVGRTLVYLNGTDEECRFGECNLGNLICDAMVHHNIKYPNELQWNHVSSCILNSGSIQASIDEQIQNGSISMAELMSVLPFGNTFDIVQLKGSTLRQAFEHSIRRFGEGSGEFLQVSGFNVKLDLSKSPGKRVAALYALCTDCRVPQYEPVDNGKIYEVVLPSFLADGGDGYAMIRDEKLKHDTGDLDVAIVADYIKKMERVHPAEEGRITFFNAGSVSASHVTRSLQPLLLLSLVWTVLNI